MQRTSVFGALVLAVLRYSNAKKREDLRADAHHRLSSVVSIYNLTRHVRQLLTAVMHSLHAYSHKQARASV